MKTRKVSNRKNGLGEEDYMHLNFVADIGKEEPSPMMLIMDYMKKHIDQIHKARTELKSQYPDLLP